MQNLILIVLTAVLVLAYVFMRGQPDVIAASTLEFVWIAVLISVSILAVRLISYLVVDVILTRSQRKQPSDLVRLIVSIFLYGTCIVLIFRAQGKDIAVLLTTSALLTAIIGFALQATLGNLFGGVAMQIEQPFQIGDWIKLDDMLGKVEALRWRSIVMRKPTNALIVIPNNRISRVEVEVFPLGSPSRSDIFFPAPLTTSPETVRELVKAVLLSTPNISRAKAPFVRVVEFDNAKASLKYQIGYFLEDYGHKNGTDALILERVWYALLRHGIEIPSPVFYDGADEPMPLLHIKPEQTAAADNRLDIILSTPLFKSLNPQAGEILAQRVIRHLFASGEPVVFRDESTCSIFIVSQGSLNIEMVAAPPSQAAPAAIAAAVKESDRVENGSGADFIPQWNPRVLEELTEKFVVYMGPVADILVKRAAQDTACPYNLYRIVAEEIPDPDDRVDFLAKAPPYPFRHLQAGEFFGETSLFFGEVSGGGKMEAVTELELLEIRPPAIKALLSEDPNHLILLSKNLAEHEIQTLYGPGYSVTEAGRTAVSERISRFYTTIQRTGYSQ